MIKKKERLQTLVFLIIIALSLWLVNFNKPYLYYNYRDRILLPSIFIGLILGIYNFFKILSDKNQESYTPSERFGYSLTYAVGSYFFLQIILFSINSFDVTLPIKEEYNIKWKTFRQHAFAIDINEKHNLLTLPIIISKYEKIYDKAEKGDIIKITYKKGLIGVPVIKHIELKVKNVQ